MKAEARHGDLPCTIRNLCERLCAIPAGSFSRERVLEEIGRTVIDPVSLQKYMFFSPVHYTRNLIYRCDLFEVVAIGWDVGQVAPIHNHRGQECWMGVPAGRLEVRNFRLREHDPVTRTCSLDPTDTYLLDPEHPAAVNPEEPIHSVHNLDSFGERAISVHVYSRPFDRCEVYFLDEGRYMEMELCYTSRYGELCDGEIAKPSAC
jgi:cysteine dioxygenase